MQRPTLQPNSNSPIMRSTLAKHERALVGGLLLIYYYVLCTAIPVVPYVPNTLITPTILCLFGIYLYGIRRPIAAHLRLYDRTYQTRILLYMFALAPMSLNGLLRGNGFSIFAEFGFFLLFAFFLLMGGHDRVWHVIDRPMTIMVYVSFLMMIIFKDTVASQGIGDSFDPNFRFTNTVAFRLRPMMLPAFFIFIWGCVNKRTRIWKLLQTGTLALLLVSEVGLFKFRSALGLVLLSVTLVLFVYPIFQYRKIHPKNYILICVIVIVAFASFLQLGYLDGFMTRVERTSYVQTSIFASRQNELDVFFNEMGGDVILGRGLGGRFDASSVFGRIENSHRWSTVHIGIFSLVLRGGYIYLALFLSFFLPVLRRKHRLWYDNPCNTASVLFVFLILVNMLTSPFAVSLPYFLRYLWFALALSRLGTIGRWPPKRLVLSSPHPSSCNVI